jgi:hypothetical protein
MPVFGEKAENQKYGKEMLYADVPPEADHVCDYPEQDVGIKNTVRDKRLTIIRNYKNRKEKNEGDHAENIAGNPVDEDSVDQGVGKHTQSQKPDCNNQPG